MLNKKNYIRVPGAAAWSKKSGASNQHRHSQGREKRRPSTLMLLAKKQEMNQNCTNGKLENHKMRIFEV